MRARTIMLPLEGFRKGACGREGGLNVRGESESRIIAESTTLDACKRCCLIHGAVRATQAMDTEASFSLQVQGSGALRFIQRALLLYEPGPSPATLPATDQGHLQRQLSNHPHIGSRRCPDYDFPASMNQTWRVLRESEHTKRQTLTTLAHPKERRSPRFSATALFSHQNPPLLFSIP